MKTLFITGSSTGFGRELAARATVRGHNVVATARRPEVMADLAHDRLLATRLDVTDEPSIEAAVRAAIARFGRIDVVVNNAGFAVGGAIEEFSDAEIERQYNTNVFGVFRVLRHTLPHLRAQRSGHILNITSVGGFRSRPGFALYCSTKFALEAIGEGLYHELAPLGIHVTNVAPGAFRTEFGAAAVIAERSIDAYDETAHANLEWLRGIDGKQPGDPGKAAVAMLDLLEMPNPPLRLILGSDSVDAIRDKLVNVAADMDAHEATSRAMDFDAEG